MNRAELRNEPREAAQRVPILTIRSRLREAGLYYPLRGQGAALSLSFTPTWYERTSPRVSGPQTAFSSRGSRAHARGVDSYFPTGSP